MGSALAVLEEVVSDLQGAARRHSRRACGRPAAAGSRSVRRSSTSSPAGSGARVCATSPAIPASRSIDAPRSRTRSAATASRSTPRTSRTPCCCSRRASASTTTIASRSRRVPKSSWRGLFSQRVGWSFGCAKVFAERLPLLRAIAKRSPLGAYQYLCYLGINGIVLLPLKLVSDRHSRHELPARAGRPAVAQCGPGAQLERAAAVRSLVCQVPARHRLRLLGGHTARRARASSCNAAVLQFYALLQYVPITVGYLSFLSSRSSAPASIRTTMRGPQVEPDPRHGTTSPRPHGRGSGRLRSRHAWCRDHLTQRASGRSRGWARRTPNSWLRARATPVPGPCGMRSLPPTASRVVAASSSRCRASSSSRRCRR